MRIVRSFDALPRDARGGVFAIGNFDGLHTGHRAVVGRAGEIARQTGVPFGVITFEPQPRDYFSPNDPPFRLTPFPAKIGILERWGVECLVAVPFDKALAQTSAEDFIEKRLVGGLGLSHLVCGHDFAYGHRRAGDIALLRKKGAEHGFGVTAVEAQVADSGALYSSRAIRELLQGGRPCEAAELLGRWWRIGGTVRKGDARGRDLGFPTANLETGPYLQPSFGIYAARAGVAEAGGLRWRDAAVSLGLRPTFQGRTVLLEVHILDFTGDLYGQHLEVAMVEYLRPEERFADVAGLIAQMAADCARARALLAEPKYALDRFDAG